MPGCLLISAARLSVNRIRGFASPPLGGFAFLERLRLSRTFQPYLTAGDSTEEAGIREALARAVRERLA